MTNRAAARLAWPLGCQRACGRLSGGQAGAIEITDEMVDAGVVALHEWMDNWDYLEEGGQATTLPASRPLGLAREWNARLTRPLRHERAGLDVRPETNPSMCEALAGNALEGLVGALLIVNARRDTVIVAEVEFRAIAVQVLLALMLGGALLACRA